MRTEEVSMKTLLIVKSAVEVLAGLMFALLPSFVISVLFAVPLDAPAAISATRMLGAAILAMGLTCWLARNDSESLAARGIIAALLFYDAAAVIVLLLARFDMGLSGIGLSPAVVLHSGLGIASVICLRKSLSVSRIQ
jgi:hypothetical protein